MAGTTAYTLREPQTLARTLLVWLWIDLAASVLAVPVTLAYAAALSNLGPNTPASIWVWSPEMEAAENWNLLGLAPQMVARLVVGFLSLKWIYRVSRNAHVLSDGLSVRPS